MTSRSIPLATLPQKLLGWLSQHGLGANAPETQPHSGAERLAGTPSNTPLKLTAERARPIDPRRYQRFPGMARPW